MKLTIAIYFRKASGMDDPLYMWTLWWNRKTDFPRNRRKSVERKKTSSEIKNGKIQDVIFWKNFIKIWILEMWETFPKTGKRSLSARSSLQTGWVQAWIFRPTHCFRIKKASGKLSKMPDFFPFPGKQNFLFMKFSVLVRTRCRKPVRESRIPEALASSKREWEAEKQKPRCIWHISFSQRKKRMGSISQCRPDWLPKKSMTA